MPRRYTGRKRRRFFRPGRDRRSIGFFGRFNKRRKLYKQERKFHDVFISDSSLTAAAQFLVTSSTGPSTASSTLIGIGQGVTEQKRLGRKCTILKIQARLNFEFLVVASADMTAARQAHETVRIICYIDTQCNGIAAQAAQVLTSDLYNRFRQLSSGRRFRTIYDKMITFNTTAVAAGDGAANDSEVVIRDYQINFSKNLYLPIEYSATTGALTEIRTNNIGLLVWTKHGARMAIIDSVIRIRFIG